VAPGDVDDLLAVTRRLNEEAAAGRVPYEPPAGKGTVLFTLHSVDSSAGAEVQNYNELFSEPPCPECELPRGMRTTEPIRVWIADQAARWCDGVGAVLESRRGPTFTLFSADFLSLLTPEERAAFEWREAIRRDVKSKKVLYEIVGSRVHVAPATLRGGNPDRLLCDVCGFVGPACYNLTGCLPAWLAPGNDFTRRGQPVTYLADRDLPMPVPTCLTVGDWREGVRLAMTAERWATLEGKRGTSCVTRPAPIGVVAHEVVEDRRDA
jgi:hypothetical protein